jgi:hypothetical protein
MMASLSHRGLGLMPYGLEAEASALKPLRAGGFAKSFLNRTEYNPATFMMHYSRVDLFYITRKVAGAT